MSFSARFDPERLAFEVAGILLSEIAPLVDGTMPDCGTPSVVHFAGEQQGWTVAWALGTGERFELVILREVCEPGQVGSVLRGLPSGEAPQDEDRLRPHSPASNSDGAGSSAVADAAPLSPLQRGEDAGRQVRGATHDAAIDVGAKTPSAVPPLIPLPGPSPREDRGQVRSRQPRRQSPAQPSTRLELQVSLSGFAGERRLASLGLRFGRVANVQRYLRSGYMSWDGSHFVEIDAARTVAATDPRMLAGHAVTALVSRQGPAAVLGFMRHDRYQSSLRFAFADGPLSLEAETLIDSKPFSGKVEAEPLALFGGDPVEAALTRWAELTAAASPLPPRLPARRISGWCSWYNLYASISEANLLEHLDASRAFRESGKAPFDIFLVDDGFTPEMGDWLDVKPQFPRGMQPLLQDIAAAGFTPGLWIAPFMVGNRSRLYAEHPDWVVRHRETGRPLAPMTFYGEFRWHKRSEEYYVLDVTHPQAEAHMRAVFRSWAKDWGCGYFKTDFMHLGSTYGPAEARWHRDGLSRIEIWMIMARLIREEIGEALWLCCGAPLYPPVGLADAMRIGRDIGVSWKGHYSAEWLLRDQTSRNFANGVLWQADPDCILLRDRFHDLTDDQVRSLARFAGLAGGVLMTSDHLGEVPAARRDLLAELAGDGGPFRCEFPLLGRGPLRHMLATGPTGQPMAASEGDPVIVQRVTAPDGSVLLNVFNTGDLAADRLLDWRLAGLDAPGRATEPDKDDPPPVSADGIHLSLRPYESRLLAIFRS